MWPSRISQNWFYVKSEWQKNFHTVEQSIFPIRLLRSVHITNITRYDSDGQFEADIVVLNSVCLQAVLHGQFFVKFLNPSNTFWMQIKSVPLKHRLVVLVLNIVTHHWCTYCFGCLEQWYKVVIQKLYSPKLPVNLDENSYNFEQSLVVHNTFGSSILQKQIWRLLWYFIF